MLSICVSSEETHIAGNISAFPARKKRNVLVVQVVVCCLRLVPIQFVKFLKKKYDFGEKGHRSSQYKVNSKHVHYLADILGHLSAVSQLWSVI